MELKLELYVELFTITDWRDGCVYRTRSQGHGWYPETLVKDNRPHMTNLIYAAPSDAFSATHSSVRLLREKAS